MLDVLNYLHSLSPPVVHRDFTPDNLVLDQANQLYLIDFEVARLHKGESNASATMVGKHSYIPPEQIRGNPSPASDLYALGATLYFLYMGKDPEPLSRLSLQATETDNDKLGFDQESFEKLNEMVGLLTQLDENKRPSIAQIKSLIYNEREEDKEEEDQPLTIKINDKETITVTTKAKESAEA
jgi:serine/threonine protein kinase